MTELLKEPVEQYSARFHDHGDAQFTALVAEDDRDMRSLLVDWLEAMDGAVIEFGDGHALIDWLLRTPSDQLRHIDVIVTDERMPGPNGLAALESLWFMQLPPVLLITAYGDTRIWARARGLRNVSVLAKPFGREMLWRAVSDILHAGDDA